MVKQTAEEIRKQVLEEDAKRDVSIYLSIPIGVIAGVSAAGAICAVITMRALVYFRQGVDAHWLSCVPDFLGAQRMCVGCEASVGSFTFVEYINGCCEFLFPVVTGLFAAYKKQFALLGVHLSVNLLAMLMGGFGFGMTVEPIFINSHICVQVYPNVSCERTTLSYIYLISGSLAAGFAVIGFLMTLCALHSATKRIAHREYEAHLQHLREQEEKQKELRQRKAQGDNRGRTLSITSQSSHSPAANNLAQAPKGQAAASKGAKEGKAGDDLITRL